MSESIDRERAIGALGAEVAELFLDLAEPLPVEAALKMAEAVEQHLVQVRVEVAKAELLDLELGQQVAEACKALLDLYGSLDQASRAAVVGAVRYFVQQQDVDQDLGSVLGFDDDALVVNYVIELIGQDVPRVGAPG